MLIRDQKKMGREKREKMFVKILTAYFSQLLEMKLCLAWRDVSRQLQI